MDVMLRLATKEDAPQIIEHTSKVIRESTFLLTSPEEFDVTIEKEEKFIEGHQKPGSILVVAEVDDTIIGVVGFQTAKRKRLSHLGYLGISIQEAYCNQGLGRRLLEYLLEWAEKEPGVEKVCLEVFSHNERAINLYKKLGFQEEGRKVKFVKLAEDHYEDEILMYKYVK